MQESGSCKRRGTSRSFGIMKITNRRGRLRRLRSHPGSSHNSTARAARLGGRGIERQHRVRHRGTRAGCAEAQGEPAAHLQSVPRRVYGVQKLRHCVDLRRAERGRASLAAVALGRAGPTASVAAADVADVGPRPTLTCPHRLRSNMPLACSWICNGWAGAGGNRAALERGARELYKDVRIIAQL